MRLTPAKINSPKGFKVETIDLKYLLSGHFLFPNNQDFDLVGKNKKKILQK